MQLYTAGLLGLGVAGMLVVLVTEVTASRRSLSALARQEVLLAQSSRVRSCLLQLSESLRELAQNPASQGLLEVLAAADRDLRNSLEQPLGPLPPHSELLGQWTTIRSVCQETVQAGRQRVLQAAKSDPKAAQQQFVTAFLPGCGRVEAMLSTFQEQLKKEVSNQLFLRGNKEVAGICLAGGVLLVLLALGVLQFQALGQGPPPAGSAAATSTVAPTAPTSAALPFVPAIGTRQAPGLANDSLKPPGASEPSKGESRLAEALPAGPRPANDAGGPAIHPTPSERGPSLPQAITELLRLAKDRAMTAWRSEFRLGLEIELDKASAQSLRQQGVAALPAPQAASAPNSEAAGPALKILIVEDDNVSRLLLRRILERKPGHEIMEAVHGREALEVLERGFVPDLCIADIAMPEMDGIKMLQEMRSDPRWRQLEVVFYTAMNDQECVARAGELHARNYLLKPFSAQKVWEQVKAAQERKARRNHPVGWAQAHLGIDDSSYASLLGALTEEISQATAGVRVDLARGDRRSAATRANAVRGACMNLGDDSLLTATRSLEAAIHSGDLDRIIPEVERLETENKRLRTNANHSAVMA